MPTIFRKRGVRVAFASNDCPERPHVHAIVGRAQAKLWLDPNVELEGNHGLTKSELQTAARITRERRAECLAFWHRHCDPSSNG
jgi:hypothetical protein